jgi:hypothetical protein
MSYPYLTRATDLRAFLKTMTVDIPELEQTVILKQLALSQHRVVQTGDPIQILAAMIVDAEGNRVYTGADGIRALDDMPLSVSNRLIKAAIDMMGLSKEAAELLEKNSERNPNGDSRSASPVI